MRMLRRSGEARARPVRVGGPALTRGATARVLGEPPDAVPACLKCGERRFVERINPDWSCQACATAWRGRHDGHGPRETVR